eukprot:4849120-Amphidinium_carterae.1
MPATGTTERFIGLLTQLGLQHNETQQTLEHIRQHPACLCKITSMAAWIVANYARYSHARQQSLHNIQGGKLLV